MVKRISPFKYGLLVMLVFVLVIAVSLPAFGLQPFKIDQYVTDKAVLLTETKRSELSRLLDEYAKQTSNQIVVITIPSLEQEELVDFTERLFELNRPGQKGKDNGIILLIAAKERSLRIEVGYGLEEQVPDGKAGAIIREQITPYFRAGDYASGITNGIYSLIKAITPDYSLAVNELPPLPVEHQGRGSLPLPFLIILIIIGFSIFGGIGGSQANRRRFRRGYSEPWFWGGGFGGGSGSSGGGFSGGGGSFGGGGASGKW